ncbi:MAG: hypothetical protein IJO33_04935 [Bacilli bacterium]|nr:hypothetical protein [Bacilli bacterium]
MKEDNLFIIIENEREYLFMNIGIDIDDTLAQTTNYLMPLAIKFDKNVLHKNGIVDCTKDLPRCFDWNSEEFLKELNRYL